jgi:hypothetical protein
VDKSRSSMKLPLFAEFTDLFVAEQIRLKRQQRATRKRGGKKAVAVRNAPAVSFAPAADDMARLPRHGGRQRGPDRARAGRR